MTQRTITNYEMQRRRAIAVAKQQLWSAMETIELTPLEWSMALSEMLGRVTQIGLRDEWQEDAKRKGR